MEDISDYVEIDSSALADVIVMDENDRSFVAAKISWHKSRHSTRGKKQRNRVRRLMTTVMQSKNCYDCNWERTT